MAASNGGGLRILLLVGAALLSAGASARAQSNEVLDQQSTLLTLYQKAMKADNFTEALEYTGRLCVLGEKHLQANPAIISGYFDLHGDAYTKLERHAEAAAAYERALVYMQRVRPASATKTVDLIESAADARWYAKDYAKAVSHYERVLTYRLGALGEKHEDTRQSMRDVAWCHFLLKDYASAEKFYRRGLESTRAANQNDPAIGRWLHNVADCRWNQDDRAGAVALYQQAHTFRLQQLGPLHEDTLFSQRELVDAYEKLDRIADAEGVLKSVVTACEATGNSTEDVATALLNLATFYQDHDREAELEPLYQRVIKIREAVHGKDHSELAETLHDIGNIYHDRGKFAVAEQYHLRGLGIREQAADRDDANLAYSHLCAGIALEMVGKFRQAEINLRAARDLRQRHFGDDTEEVAEATTCLAELYLSMGRNTEAVVSAERALATYRKQSGERALELARPLSVIGNVRYDEGRYAEAEASLRLALSIQEEQLGEEHVDLTFTLDNLANVVQDQQQFKVAHALRQRALAIGQQHYGEDHPSMAHLLNNMASLHEAEKQWPEAEKLYRQALDIWSKADGKDHVNVAFGLHNVANCESEQGRLADAEAKHRQALSIRLAAYGAEHPLVAASQSQLAKCLIKTGRGAEAEELLDRSITTLARTRVSPTTLFESYVARGELSWAAQRKAEALADMRRAMDLAEQIRGQSGGAEQERAQHFSQFAEVYEQVLAWQIPDGDPGEAFAAIERSRARSLLDEMNLGGADINAGSSTEDRQQATRRQAELKEQIARLESQLLSAENEAQRRELDATLVKARGQLYEHFRDQRSGSEVYRKLLAVGGDSLRLSQLQRRLGEVKGHLLVYFLGAKAGYVLSIRPTSARLFPLRIDAAHAKTLNVEAGAVTNTQLRDMLMRQDGAGIVQQVANPNQSPPTARLHALWNTLVPAEVQQEVLDSQTQRMVIVPDGALALLPFETLVVATAPTSKYLLEAGPPISYAPSATVLFNLYERAPASRYAAAPIITLGDPSYAQTSSKPALSGGAGDDSSQRYGSSGGRLTSLPHTGVEATWVSDVFARAGLSVDKLVKTDATEANLRNRLGQRMIVHLACHGLTDHTYGNFFGALALTAGPEAATTASDDGFLTLSEIYELDLRDCELAILSACETNYGPQQEGEGTWALSRGFLVAGSRRVIASNWLVDDQAAASLVSYYCGNLAKTVSAKQEKTDYAASLQSAKRWLAAQPKWRHPYYWGALVLVGPE